MMRLLQGNMSQSRSSRISMKVFIEETNILIYFYTTKILIGFINLSPQVSPNSANIATIF